MRPSDLGQNRLYGDLAYLWPVLSGPEGYADEARNWAATLRDKLGPGRHRLLELGVGGGSNLSHFAGGFEVTAVDLSEAMLAHSARVNPGVEHRVGDMRTVRLGRRFNAVIIHDAISYLLTEDDIRATLATVLAHLEPGGVFVGSPDRYREMFSDPELEAEGPRTKGDIQLTYISYTHDPDPADTTIESVMLYFIRRGGELRIEGDRHILGLFPLTTWLSLMAEAGFVVEKRACSHGNDPLQPYLLIGTRTGS